MDIALKNSEVTQKDPNQEKYTGEYNFQMTSPSIGVNAFINNEESQKSLKFEVKIDDNSRLKSAAILIKKHRAQSNYVNKTITFSQKPIRDPEKKQKFTGIEFVPLKVHNEESSHHLAIGK